MEREKAIGLVNDAFAVYYTVFSETFTKAEREELFEANKVAVKALEQLEIISCSDCRWNDGTAYCDFHERNVNGKNFCSWAEKRREQNV